MWFDLDLPVVNALNEVSDDLGGANFSATIFEGSESVTTIWDELSRPFYASHSDETSFQIDWWDSELIRVTAKPADAVMNDDGPVVITGRRVIRLDTVSWWDAGAVPDLFWTVHMDGGGGIDFSPPDIEAIDILINFDRPLTESEAEALENLKDAIQTLTVAINMLADDATLTLPNGAIVTGATLKAIWAATDFIINDNHVAYGNMSYRGEANMVNGQPTISFNIGFLDTIDNSTGGMNWAIAHELGHLSQWGTPYVYDQRTANDIARALLNGSGLPYLSNPGDGYTESAPTGFTIAPTSGGGDDGEGYGGGGGNGDYVP